MSALWTDLRYAVRMLRKAPFFTAIAVLSLAAGMGANTAIFSLVDQVLLRLLPVKAPNQLALLSMKGMHYGSNWGGNAISYPLYEDFRDHNQVFSGMFCRFPIAASLSFSGQTERVQAELVSGTYFPVLGVTAALGRTFTAEEDRVPNGEPLVMLSYSFWKSRFGSDRGIIGKDVMVNGRNMTVVGVAQPGFDGVELGNTAQIFVPVMMKATMTPQWDGMKDRRWRWVNAFGRLKPGFTREKAQVALQPYFHGILEMEVKDVAFKNASADTKEAFLKNIIQALPGSQGRSYMRRQLETPLWFLMAATGGVLLIACANVAGLMIARASGRQKEIAIRLALGAGRWRVARQLLVESVLLAMVGSACGLVLAAWTMRGLLAMVPAETVDLHLSTTPDLRVLLFTAVVSCFTGILFGLAPALQSTRPNLAPTLKDQAGSVVGGGSPVRLRKALVAAQVTLSLLLLIGAGLFLRSLANLKNLGPGFATDRLMVFNVDPSLNGYDNERIKAFYRRLSDELRALPGVHAVGLASVRILEDGEWDSSTTVEGYNVRPADAPEPYMNSVSPGYFAAMGVPIVEGRDFTTQDTARILHGEQTHKDKPNTVPTVVMINEKFAHKFFGGADPIGRHVGFGSDPGTKTDMEVIGVVKDIKYTSLRDEIPVQMFVPYLADDHVGDMTAYVRASTEPSQILPLLRARVHDLDANLPVYSMRSMDEQVSKSLLIERLVSGLATVFGGLATLLAGIGLYGVMAYTVERRTREIGIRMALGALRGDVIWLVMREVLVLVAIGVTVGLAGALGLAQYVQSQLYGVTRDDPATIALATTGLAMVAAFAGYVPALRASRADPMQALRYE
jgi:predicted permease